MVLLRWILVILLLLSSPCKPQLLLLPCPQFGSKLGNVSGRHFEHHAERKLSSQSAAIHRVGSLPRQPLPSERNNKDSTWYKEQLEAKNQRQQQRPQLPEEQKTKSQSYVVLKRREDTLRQHNIKQGMAQMKTKSTLPSNFQYRFQVPVGMSLINGQQQKTIRQHEALAKSLPVCKQSQHINGVWVTSNESDRWQQKSYVCCASNTQDNMNWNLVEECGAVKRVYYDEKTTIRFGSDDHRILFESNSCACDAKNGGKMKVSQRERYKWFPSECRLLDWDAKQFCALLGVRTLVLYGDSTQGQLFGSLVAQIYAGKGGCAHQIQRIPVMSTAESIDKLLNYLKTIVAPTIVVLNQGPHFQSTEDVTSYIEHLHVVVASVVQSTAAATAGNISFVWRTTSPGHYKCDNISEPMSPANPRLQLSAGADHYRYSLFPYWDDLLIAAAKKLNIPVMDMSPLYFRADAHPGSFENGGYDCLHNCLPGPVDMGAPILLQMLYNGEIQPVA